MAWRAHAQPAQSAITQHRARQHMPYTVSVDEQHQLVEVVYSGHITISTRVCAMEDGAILLESRQYRRVLVDLHEAVTESESLDVGNVLASRLSHRPRVVTVAWPM